MAKESQQALKVIAASSLDNSVIDHYAPQTNPTSSNQDLQGSQKLFLSQGGGDPDKHFDPGVNQSGPHATMTTFPQTTDHRNVTVNNTLRKYLFQYHCRDDPGELLNEALPQVKQLRKPSE